MKGCQPEWQRPKGRHYSQAMLYGLSPVSGADLNTIASVPGSQSGDHEDNKVSTAFLCPLFAWGQRCAGEALRTRWGGGRFYGHRVLGRGGEQRGSTFD